LLANDEDGHHQGDLTISYPEDTANRLNDFMHQFGFGESPCPPATGGDGQDILPDLERCEIGLKITGDVLMRNYPVFKGVYDEVINLVVDPILANVEWTAKSAVVISTHFLEQTAKIPSLSRLPLKMQAQMATLTTVLVIGMVVFTDHKPDFRHLYIPKTSFRTKKKRCLPTDASDSTSPVCSSPECLGVGGMCTLVWLRSRKILCIKC
jgi:hypothetical protein